MFWVITLRKNVQCTNWWWSLLHLRKADCSFAVCSREEKAAGVFGFFFFFNFFKVSKNLFLVLCVVCKIPASFKAWFLKIPSFSSLFPAGNTWAVQSTPHFSFPPWVYCHALKKKTKKPRILRISQWKWITGLFIGSFFILAVLEVFVTTGRRRQPVSFLLLLFLFPLFLFFSICSTWPPVCLLTVRSLEADLLPWLCGKWGINFVSAARKKQEQTEKQKSKRTCIIQVFQVKWDLQEDARGGR